MTSLAVASCLGADSMKKEQEARPVDEIPALSSPASDTSGQRTTEFQFPSGPTFDGSDSTRPDLKWEQTLGVDINCDGSPDYTYITQDETHFYVAVMLGPLAARRDASVVAFLLSGNSQDSFCGPAEPLAEESMDVDLRGMLGYEPEGFHRSRHCVGLLLAAGECDPFHLFWNYRHQRLDWWRL